MPAPLAPRLAHRRPQPPILGLLRPAVIALLLAGLALVPATSLIAAPAPAKDKPAKATPANAKPQAKTNAKAQPQLTYRIGNSLTWDSQPKAIELLAAQRKIKHRQGYHINCGKSLQRIWSMPKEHCVKPAEPFGIMPDALPNLDWHAVTFQPHPGKDSTLGSDEARILDMIKLTQSKGKNKDTVFYIYAAWPGQQLGPYVEAWKKAAPDKDDTKTVQSEAYFEHLYKRVKAKTDKAGVKLHMIPAGHVLYELAKLAKAGKIKGYANGHAFYRDRVHLNHVGRYMAGVTVFCTLFKQNPIGLKCPPKAYGDGKDLNDQLYKAIHMSVMDTILKRWAQTGVTINDLP